MSSRMPPHVAHAVIDRAGGTCEAMCSPECRWTGTEIHHRKLRSQGGAHTLSNCIFVCHICHGWIHAHTGDAYDMELLVHGWDEPAYPCGGR